MVALLVGGLLTPAFASELRPVKPFWFFTAPRQELPFPRSERAHSVWTSGACWSECGSYCTWGLAGCLQIDGQGRCLQLTDKCDRYCQRECRTRGGPLMPYVDF